MTETALGLLLVLGVIWISTHIPVDTKSTSKKHAPPACNITASEVMRQLRSTVPSPLAKGKSRLVKCSVPSKGVPLYRRSEYLLHRAGELATSVAVGKAKIAAHKKAGSLEACSPQCAVYTTIAGVVRDRKTLKRLQYDQPF